MKYKEVIELDNVTVDDCMNWYEKCGSYTVVNDERVVNLKKEYGNMLILIGKTASGKDTIVNKLISKHDFKKIIAYTSRPKRNSEKDGITYHYISAEDFLQKIEEGFFAEWKAYNTEFGTWYYGSALEDLEKAQDNSVIILTPDGYRDVVSKLKNKSKCIYIYANNETIKKRLIARGDDIKEAERRLEHDNEDFKDFEYEADKIFYNNDGTDIDTVVKRILKFVR